MSPRSIACLPVALPIALHSDPERVRQRSAFICISLLLLISAPFFGMHQVVAETLPAGTAATLPAAGTPATAVAAPPAGTPAGATTTAETSVSQPDQAALATAIALNYCRASFHRIRKSPTPEVLREEQEKILNNLNLTQLNDPEVIQLYTSVLDEIGQVGLADRERALYKKHHSSVMTRKITWDAVAFTTDLATAQFGNAIRTGANSWWDYRSLDYNRESDLLKVDRARMNSVVQKSSQFLDTFWRMAQKKQIPDRWLVRGDDLDQLEGTLAEKDPEVRLRVLKRMGPFMEAYPPYWYYLGRTQQQLGYMADALATYERLEAIGKGHFRKDEMLATALANQAVILEGQQAIAALSTADRALAYAAESWEANLICARILERHGRLEDAEDAILRNLDTNLETQQSRVFLASHYYHSAQHEKLASFLGKPEVVAELPAPVLLRCAALLGPQQTPPAVMASILHSIEAQPRLTFGPDELIVRAAPAWQLHLAQLRAYYNEQELPRPQLSQQGNWLELRYSGQDWGNPIIGSSAAPVRLEFRYPDEKVIRVVLEDGRQPSVRGPLPMTQLTLKITDIQVDEQKLALYPQPVPATTSTTSGTPLPVSELPPESDALTRSASLGGL
jgi:hypothetical protein